MHSTALQSTKYSSYVRPSLQIELTKYHTQQQGDNSRNYIALLITTFIDVALKRNPHKIERHEPPNHTHPPHNSGHSRKPMIGLPDEESV